MDPVGLFQYFFSFLAPLPFPRRLMRSSASTSPYSFALWSFLYLFFSFCCGPWYGHFPRTMQQSSRVSRLQRPSFPPFPSLLHNPSSFFLLCCVFSYIFSFLSLRVPPTHAFPLLIFSYWSGIFFFQNPFFPSRSPTALPLKWSSFFTDRGLIFR